MDKNTSLVAVLVLGLLVGGGVGYYAAPPQIEETVVTNTVNVEILPLDGKNIQIGYLTTTQALETARPWYSEIETDMNSYAAKLGYDVTFQYLVDDDQNQAAIHLEKVQGFHSIGVDRVVNAGGSSKVAASMGYMNENNMILWSETSTSPIISVPDDCLFRMIPNDLVQAPAIAKMLWTYGIKACIFVHVANAWGDGIYNILNLEYAKYGGIELEHIRFAIETQEFSTYLQAAEEALGPAIEEYGAEHVAMHFVAGTPIVTWLSQANNFPLCDSVTWFGSDGEVLLQQMIDDAPDAAMKHKVISTGPIPGSSKKWQDLSDRYFDLLALPLGHGYTNGYDIAMVLMKTMLEAQSEDPSDIIPLQIPTCYDYFGASGWCRLDESGDRAGVDYNLWGVKEVNGEPTFVVYGIFNFLTDEILWDTEMLGFVPEPPE